MRERGFVIHFVLVAVVSALIIGLIGWTSWKQGKVTIDKTISESSLSILPTCNSENLMVEVVENEDRPYSVADDVTIAINNLDDGTKSSIKIDNVPKEEAHFFEIGKCYFYIKKVVGNKYELWRYNYEKQGERIYQSQLGFDFSVSTSEKLLAINSHSIVAMFTIASGEKIQEVSIEDLKKPLVATHSSILESLDINLQGWNEGESEMWGSLSAAAYIEAFWKLNIKTGKIEIFSELFEPTPNNVLLNTDKEVYAVSDKPLFFDMEEYEYWKNETNSYSVHIYSLRTKSSTLVDALPSSWSPGMLSPLMEWVSPTQLKYSTPKGEKIYTLNLD